MAARPAHRYYRYNPNQTGLVVATMNLLAMVENAMSVRKLAAGLLTTVITLGTASGAWAQGVSGGPALPPVDPFAFDPQFRWFEPVYDIDLEELKPEKRAASGWFATYDRLNLYGSRPETADPNLQGGELKLDSGYGHRYELGYMRPHADTGYTFTYTENDVTELFTVRNEAANRFVNDDPGASVTQNIRGQTVPTLEGNNLNFQTRFFDENRTINQMDYESYEFNKTWRLTPYHYGGILEPMIGFRYADLDDTNLIDDFDRAVDLSDGSLNSTVGGGLTDEFIRQEADTENDVYLGQVGFRYFKQQNRFNYVGDFRFFAGGNSQCSTFRQTSTFIGYGDDTTITIGEAGDVTEIESTEPVIIRDDAFVWGFDIRGTLGYQVTRMIQVRAGFQLIDYATGIWRGGDATNIISGDRDQDYVMFGGTFGISLNH